MFNDESEFSVENVGCPTSETLDASKMLSYAVSDVSYDSASHQLNSTSTFSTSFSAIKRRSTIRQKCASALVNVCAASRRAVSNVTCHTGEKEPENKDVSSHHYYLKTSPDKLWNTAIRTMARPTSLEWSNDQFRLAKLAVQSVRTVQELSAHQACGEYIRRDLLGRHVRDLPRSTLSEQKEIDRPSRISLDEDHRNDETQNRKPFTQQRSKSVIEELLPCSKSASSKKSNQGQHRKSERRPTGHSRFKFWSDQIENPIKASGERRSKLRVLPILQWKGYRHESGCESDSLDSDCQTPYDSIRTNVDIGVLAATGNDDRAPDTSGDEKNNGKSSREGMARAYSRKIGTRKISLVRAPTGESIGIVSCESGPLPSWLEEAVWEVETTGSEILSC